MTIKRNGGFQYCKSILELLWHLQKLLDILSFTDLAGKQKTIKSHIKDNCNTGNRTCSMQCRRVIWNCIAVHQIGNIGVTLAFLSLLLGHLILGTFPVLYFLHVLTWLSYSHAKKRY